MPTEFELSIIEHAVASGRDANCFFQSFFHTLTSLPKSALDQVQREYSNSIQAFVDTFNRQLSLEPPVDFNRIMDMSRSMHPLERECVFGPILRHTYNTMIDRHLLSGDKLQINPDAIVFSTQTVGFSNAFGAKYSVYMSQEQFDLSVAAGMPPDVAERIKATRFEIGDRVFYCDCPPAQNTGGDSIFDLDIIYADKHLNYTLGTRALNNAHRELVITERTSSRDGIFAVEATCRADAPMAEKALSFDSIAALLRERFALTERLGKRFEAVPKWASSATTPISSPPAAASAKAAGGAGLPDPESSSKIGPRKV